MRVSIPFRVPPDFVPVEDPEQLAVLSDWFEERGAPVAGLLRAIARVWTWRAKAVSDTLNLFRTEPVTGVEAWVRYSGGWARCRCHRMDRAVSPHVWTCEPLGWAAAVLEPEIERDDVTFRRPVVLERAFWELVFLVKKPKWKLHWAASWKHTLIARALTAPEGSVAYAVRTLPKFGHPVPGPNLWPFVVDRGEHAFQPHHAAVPELVP